MPGARPYSDQLEQSTGSLQLIGPLRLVGGFWPAVRLVGMQPEPTATQPPGMVVACWVRLQPAGSASYVEQYSRCHVPLQHVSNQPLMAATVCVRRQHGDSNGLSHVSCGASTAIGRTTDGRSTSAMGPNMGIPSAIRRKLIAL